MPDKPPSLLGPNKQITWPDRPVRSAKSLLLKSAAMIETLAKAIQERGEVIKFRVETDDNAGFKQIWEISKDEASVRALNEYVTALRTVAEKLDVPIEMLKPSLAIKEWCRGLQQNSPPASAYGDMEAGQAFSGIPKKPRNAS